MDLSVWNVDLSVWNVDLSVWNVDLSVWNVDVLVVVGFRFERGGLGWERGCRLFPLTSGDPGEILVDVQVLGHLLPQTLECPAGGETREEKRLNVTVGKFKYGTVLE